MIEVDTNFSAISPLERVVKILFEKVYQLAVGDESHNEEDLYKEYDQRLKALYVFLDDLEKNPFGFPQKEIKSLEERAVDLADKLAMIKLTLDALPHSPLIVAESIMVYSKDYESENKIVEEFSRLEDENLRMAFLQYCSTSGEKILLQYPSEVIQTTVTLLNEYVKETPKEMRNYQQLLSYLAAKKVIWIPIGRELYQSILEEKKISMASRDESVRLRQIQRKVDAYELEVVPEEEKALRLQEIQALKSELTQLTQETEKINELQAKLDSFAKLLLPKEKGMGFFGGLKTTTLVSA